MTRRLPLAIVPVLALLGLTCSPSPSPAVVHAGAPAVTVEEVPTVPPAPSSTTSTTQAPAPTPSSTSTTAAPPAASTTTTVYTGATCQTSDPALAGDCGTTSAEGRGWRDAAGTCLVTDDRTGRAWNLQPDPACNP